jgi:hypothetical protein
LTPPLLGTPAQIEAERTLLQLLADPEVVAIQQRLCEELAAVPTGQTPAGAAGTERARDPASTNGCPTSCIATSSPTRRGRSAASTSASTCRGATSWVAASTSGCRVPRPTYVSKHGYTLEEFGINGDEIARSFPAYRERFGELLGEPQHSQ